MLLFMTRSLRRSLRRAPIEREIQGKQERKRLVAYEDGVVFEVSEARDGDEPYARVGA